MDVDMDMTIVVSPSPSAANRATAAAIQELYTVRGAHAKLLDEFRTTRAELLEVRPRLRGAVAAGGDSKGGVGPQDGEGGSEDVEVLRRGLKAEEEKEEEKRVLYEREAKFLKDLMGSYETERERDSGSNLDTTDSSANVSSEELKRLREKLREMERVLEEYKLSNGKLGDEVGRLGGSVVGSVGGGDESKKMRWSVEELVKDYESLKGDNEKLKEESTTTLSTHPTNIDTLEQTLFELRGEIAGGRHVPAHTRVLEMEDNPERRTDRSKLDDTTQMQLIAQSEQGGPQDLPSMMHYWIETKQCIPGFLASVTLECWEGSKRGK